MANVPGTGTEPDNRATFVNSAVPVEFVAEAEPWCKYVLDDGSVVRVRVMLVKVTRDGLDANGNPNYQLQMQQVCDLTPSDLAIASAKEEQTRKETT